MLSVDLRALKMAMIAFSCKLVSCLMALGHISMGSCNPTTYLPRNFLFTKIYLKPRALIADVNYKLFFILIAKILTTRTPDDNTHSIYVKTKIKKRENEGI
jgi:hypothetical protein